MVIADLNDHVVPMIEAEKELKLVKAELLENNYVKAYGHILTALVALRHARDLIATKSKDSSVEFQQHQTVRSVPEEILSSEGSQGHNGALNGSSALRVKVS